MAIKVISLALERNYVCACVNPDVYEQMQHLNQLEYGNITHNETKHTKPYASLYYLQQCPDESSPLCNSTLTD